MELASLSVIVIMLVQVQTFLILPCIAETQAKSARVMSNAGIMMDLIRIDALKDFTKLEMFRRGIERSKHRIEKITTEIILHRSEGNNESKLPISVGSVDFIVEFGIGTPAKTVMAIVDTASDLLWMPCKPCSTCSNKDKPNFDPSHSSSFSKISCKSLLCSGPSSTSSSCESDCRFNYQYIDGSKSQGIMAYESFTFNSKSQSASMLKLGFGCGNTNKGLIFTQGTGVFGLGRGGSRSLIKQLNIRKFSYCINSFGESKPSHFFFGSLANLKKIPQTKSKSTQIITNPRNPSAYYVSLLSIIVGETRLKVPKSTFALKKDGTGGVMMDASSSITQLEENAYSELKNTFLSMTKAKLVDSSLLGLDLCFSLTSLRNSDWKDQVPKLVFEFKAANISFPVENFMVLDQDTGVMCLAIMKGKGISVIGNIQQQNMYMHYDLEKNKMSFTPTRCDHL